MGIDVTDIFHAGDIGNLGLISGLQRSPGGGNDNPFSILAWETPGTEEPGGLQMVGVPVSFKMLVFS